MSGEDEELAYSPASPTAGGGDVRPLWMKQLQEVSSHWLKLLPKVSTNSIIALYTYSSNVRLGVRCSSLAHTLFTPPQTYPQKKISKNRPFSITPEFLFSVEF